MNELLLIVLTVAVFKGLNLFIEWVAQERRNQAAKEERETNTLKLEPPGPLEQTIAVLRPVSALPTQDMANMMPYDPSLDSTILVAEPEYHHEIDLEYELETSWSN